MAGQLTGGLSGSYGQPRTAYTPNSPDPYSNYNDPAAQNNPNSPFYTGGVNRNIPSPGTQGGVTPSWGGMEQGNPGLGSGNQQTGNRPDQGQGGSVGNIATEGGNIQDGNGQGAEYGQTHDSTHVGGGMYQDNTYFATDPSVNPNSFQYGGHQGGADEWNQFYQNRGDAAQGRQGPQIDQGGLYNAYLGDRGAQMQGLQMQRQAALGQTPSVAQNQMQAGMQAANAQSAATAASARGGGANLAAAQRQGQMQQGAMAAQTNQQTGLLRAQEMENARNAYNQNAAMMAQQSGGLAQQQAQLNSQQMGRNDTMSQAYLNAQQGVNQQQLQAQMAQQQLQSQNSVAIQGLNQKTNGENAAAANSASGGLAGAGVAAVGALAMMSDMRVKKDIRPGTWDASEALAQLVPSVYEYKDPERHGEGPRVGIMAQDLQKSRAGKEAVIPTKDGLAIDVNKGLSLALAGSAAQEHRLRALEMGPPPRQFPKEPWAMVETPEQQRARMRAGEERHISDNAETARFKVPYRHRPDLSELGPVMEDIAATEWAPRETNETPFSPEELERIRRRFPHEAGSAMVDKHDGRGRHVEDYVDIKPFALRRGTR